MEIKNKDNQDKKLNIGIFCDSFFPMVDGVVNVIDNYAKRLCKYANVTLFVPQGRDKTYVDNFPYEVIRCTKRFKCPGLDYDLPLPDFDADFLDKLEQKKLDIVHIHSPFSLGKLGLKYATKNKIPCVATLHSQFKQDFYEATKSKALTGIMMNNIMPTFNKCDECWAVNKAVAHIYHDDYKLKKMPKIRNNATDMVYFDNQAEIDNLRQSLGLKDEKVLLFVGRIHILKNIFFIADSLKVLKDKNFNFKMIFVGTGPDEEKLREYITKLGLDDKVLFAGRICDRDLLAKYYRLADLFVFPSMYDASSLVQIEASSQKTPTLFLKGSATSGTCTEDEDCYMSEHDSVKYAEKIIEIFSDNEKYQKICDGAYNNLYITWDQAVENLLADYEDVIQKYKEGYYKKLEFYKKNKKQAKQKVVAKRKKAQKGAVKTQKEKDAIDKKIEALRKKIEKEQQKLEKLSKERQ